LQSDPKIKVVIAEDNQLHRQGLRFLLADQDNIEIVGEANNGIQAFDVIEDSKPDVVIINVNMPEFQGIDFIPIIKDKCSKTKALLIAAESEDDAIMLKAIEAGAKGYLKRDTSCDCLVKAIQAVYQGELWLERRLMAKYFDKVKVARRNNLSQRNQKIDDITNREKEVLCLLMKGLTNKEIACEFFISEKTVKSHLSYQRPIYTRPIDVYSFIRKFCIISPRGGNESFQRFFNSDPQIIPRIGRRDRENVHHHSASV
jgi:DNA-binding NarL/FixJ family response regulator